MRSARPDAGRSEPGGSGDAHARYGARPRGPGAGPGAGAGPGTGAGAGPGTGAGRPRAGPGGGGGGGRKARGRPRLTESDRARRRLESRKKYDVRRVYLGEAHGPWVDLRRRSGWSDAKLAAYLLGLERGQRAGRRGKPWEQIPKKPKRKKRRRRNVNCLRHAVIWYEDHRQRCPYEPRLAELDPAVGLYTTAVWQCERGHRYFQDLHCPLPPRLRRLRQRRGSWQLFLLFLLFLLPPLGAAALARRLRRGAPSAPGGPQRSWPPRRARAPWGAAEGQGAAVEAVVCVPLPLPLRLGGARGALAEGGPPPCFRGAPALLQAPPSSRPPLPFGPPREPPAPPGGGPRRRRHVGHHLRDPREPERRRRSRRGRAPDAEGLPDPIPCPYAGCGQVYVALSSFQNHVKLAHRRGRAQQCPQPGCGKRFHLAARLRRHMLSHSGVRDFTCESCGKAFKRKNHLEVHRRTHTGETPLQCEVCGYRCRQRASLTWHMRRHALKSRPEPRGT
ncbi:zinc finger protein 653 [Anser cygnoides]|uniref:zinc finger protein 653 n=1 Tax=Anser cygnoides TaxID=8845 RepID=UPI0034D367E8